MDAGASGKLSAGQHLLASAESGTPLSCSQLTHALAVADDLSSRRCGHRGDDESDLGGQNAHVHFPCGRPQCLSQRLPYAPHALASCNTATDKQTDQTASTTDGISQLARQEGIRGLSKGMVLALVGVSNGALQFMTYEELKRWRTELRRSQLGPSATDEEVKKLVSYTCGLFDSMFRGADTLCTFPFDATCHPPFATGPLPHLRRVIPSTSSCQAPPS